jgi:hypothetical protein
MTQEEIGVRMGLAQDSERKAVSRLLNPGVDYDPRLSTPLLFAKAINKPLKDLLLTSAAPPTRMPSKLRSTSSARAATPRSI